jgi:transposase InsO family protein
MVYTFIGEEKANPDGEWSVTEMCRVLEVSRSGFYDWESRPPSQRELTDRMLTLEIEAIWECSARTYGTPRVHAWLQRQGFEVSRKRVARIMRAQGWEGESGRRKVRTTIVDRRAKAAEDRVGRDFNPTAPDVTWCGDITYLRTGEGWLYLATVIDLFSRRVIGWSLAEHMRTTLVADALETAVATRGGHVNGVIFHSDRGCQYTSASSSRWVPPECAGTTRRPRASSAASNANSLTATAGPPGPKPAAL